MSHPLLTVTFRPAATPLAACRNDLPLRCTVIRTPWHGEPETVPGTAVAYGLCCTWPDGRKCDYPAIAADLESVERLAERLEGEDLSEKQLNTVLEDFADELSWPR